MNYGEYATRYQNEDLKKKIAKEWCMPYRSITARVIDNYLRTKTNRTIMKMITARGNAIKGKSSTLTFIDERDYFINTKEKKMRRTKRAAYQWTMANGDTIDIEDMETSHIENTIMFLFRKKRDSELALKGVKDKFLIKLIKNKIKEQLSWIVKMREELKSRSDEDVVDDIYKEI